MGKYPLKPLAALREKKVEDAATELAEAVGKRAVAARALRAAEARRDAHARDVTKARAAELDALGSGRLSARDLAWADAWRIRVAADRETLVAAVARAGSIEAKARRDEAEAQAAVIVRRADARVVAAHRARWDDERRRALEAREEEASAEAWRPRR